MQTAITGEPLPALDRPVAVFDAGIGSYAAVEAIRRLLPRQDILYLADRASFPYGQKSRAELLGMLRRTLLYLDGFAPAAVLVASNAPSVTVLDDLMDVIAPPVFGVRPPIARALGLVGSGDVAVLGVRSLVLSPELRAYADAEAGSRAPNIHLVDASPLVDLVESGAFLFAPETTQETVSAFVRGLDARHPGLNAFTLSSTHLPWLRGFLEKACGDRPLLDPLDDAVATIAPHAVAGSGTVLALVTENPLYGVAEFRRMLDQLDIALPLHTVSIG